MIRPVQDIPKEAVLGETLTTLDKLEPFQEGVVTGIDGEKTSRRRLLEAGFVIGSRVRFLMATPFRDPLVYSLRGTSIALRKNEARSVCIRL